MRISIPSTAVGVLALAAFNTSVQAVSIGINYVGYDSNQQLLATDTAGVIAQQNFNNITGQGVSGPLVDSTGAAVTTTLNSSYGYNFSNGGAGKGFAGGSGDQKFLTGYASSQNADNPPTLTFTNIPYASYDVYVYVGADQDYRTGSVHLTGTGGAVDGTTYYYRAEGYATNYDLSTATAVTFDQNGNFGPFANYMHFTGDTASTLTVNYASVDPAPYGSGVYGVQIVDTTPAAPLPEPASLTLIGVGAVGLLRRRRASRA